MAAQQDTIFALSSGAPPAGVAIVRISGQGTRFAIETISGGVPTPRFANVRSIRNRNGDLLDTGVVIFFEGPKSFTGEDVGELHVHGGGAVIKAVLAALSDLPGFRLAEAGEFTRRAFENGRMDLTEVEGLADLIAAQTEFQRRHALELAQGGLSKLYESWAERLLQARALIEAEFDFSDEDDVPASVAAKVWRDLEDLVGDMDAHRSQQTIGERIRDGFRVVIAGAPNSGKSSLLNAIAKRDVAIVSVQAGTTRDIVSVDLDLDGVPVTLVDTAGLRETGDLVEKEGIRRAREAIDTADLIIAVHDAADPDEPAMEVNSISGNAPILHVDSKNDLRTGRRGKLSVSSVTGQGLNDLLDAISANLADRFDPRSLALPNRLRHAQHLSDAFEFLSQAVGGNEKPLELRAEDLRRAAEALSRIAGRTDADALLDVIFSSFCIGK